MRAGLVAWISLVGAAGCGAADDHPHDHADGDADADADAGLDADADTGCVDLDGDGRGAGAGCRGPDCDDLDAELGDDCGAAGRCAAGVHTTGCPCEGAGSSACYTGAEGTAGVGPCTPGTRTCRGGALGPCEGQVVPSPERCDPVDQDCDGDVGDGGYEECGGCDGTCRVDRVGVDSEHPFDPDGPGAVGVLLQPDGSLTAAPRVGTHVLWIANSGEGTISKIDTRTHQELGRYHTDPGLQGDPAGTAVDRAGAVVSVNLAASSATRILAGDCPDRDGDGVVETSADGTDVLAYDDEECIAWTLPIDGGAPRGVAIEEREELDGTVREIAWVGSLQSGDVYEVDVEAGALTGRSRDASPAVPHSMAMGKDGALWVASAGAWMARIDTDTFDIRTFAAPGRTSFYDVAVDPDGRPWLSGPDGTLLFDPTVEEFSLVDGACGGGIAVDAQGVVWTGHGFGCAPEGIARIDPATLAADVIETGGDALGLAVDVDGLVWGVNASAGSAHVVDPVSLDAEEGWRGGDGENTATGDMTGFQLFGFRQPGRTAWVFDAGCSSEDEPRWTALRWRAETPEGTRVTFRARSSDGVHLAAHGPSATIAVQPGDESPVPLEDALTEAGVEPWRSFLQIEAVLEGTEAGASPVLWWWEVSHWCASSPE